MSGKGKRRKSRATTHEVLKTWMDEVVGDLVRLYQYRAVFRRLHETTKGNPRLHQPSVFYNFVTDLFATYAFVAIRRHSERRGDVRSFRCLVTEAPRTLRRAAWLDAVAPLPATSPPAPPAGTPSWSVAFLDPEDRAYMRRQAERVWDSHANARTGELDAKLVRADIAELERITKRLNHYTNNPIAHLSEQAYADQIVWTDIYECLDALEKLVKKYHLLIKFVDLGQLEPITPLGWENIFLVPWIVEDATPKPWEMPPP